MPPRQFEPALGPNARAFVAIAAMLAVIAMIALVIFKWSEHWMALTTLTGSLTYIIYRSFGAAGVPTARQLTAMAREQPPFAPPDSGALRRRVHERPTRRDVGRRR